MQKIEITGPVNGCTSYCDGKMVAVDTTISLPEVTNVIAEIQTGMGTVEIPLIGDIEAMEATIKKIGVDKGLSRICKMGSRTIEFRWAQTQTKPDGSTKIVGAKAFLRCMSKVLAPGMDIEKGSVTEGDIPLAVNRYQLFVDGEELLCIDKLSQVLRIGGTDYYDQINNLL